MLLFCAWVSRRAQLLFHYKRCCLAAYFEEEIQVLFFVFLLFRVIYYYWCCCFCFIVMNLALRQWQKFLMVSAFGLHLLASHWPDFLYKTLSQISCTNALTKAKCLNKPTHKPWFPEILKRRMGQALLWLSLSCWWCCCYHFWCCFHGSSLVRLFDLSCS